MNSFAKAAGELWDRVIALAESVDEADWRRPTPCTEWDVGDLFAHLAAIQTTLDGGAQPPVPEGWEPPTDAGLDAWTAVGVAARRGWTKERIIEDLRAARDGHIRRLEAADPDAPATGPVGQTTEQGLFRVRCFDIWVHLQDLADALRRPLAFDDESDAARAANEHVHALLPWMFAKRVGAKEGDAVRFRLGHPLGLDETLQVVDGRARWVAEDEEENTVSGSAGAFTLLTAGRGSPDRWHQAGVLSWSGRLGEAVVERARMF